MNFSRQPLVMVLALTPLCVVGWACGGLSHVERSASLTVANLSNFTICHVYVGPSNGTAPVDDKLQPGERIGPDQARTFPMSAGSWNLELTDCGSRPLYAREGIRIHGSRHLEFRPIEVQRDLMFGSRRFAEGHDPTGDI